MDIQEISKQINHNARVKGFWDNGVDVPEKLMLIVSEVAEAMEADRKSRFSDWADRLPPFMDNVPQKEFNDLFEKNVKDNFEDELADAAIRIFDLAFEMGIDLSWHIKQKVRYNASRPHMHGGKKY